MDVIQEESLGEHDTSQRNSYLNQVQANNGKENEFHEKNQSFGFDQPNIGNFNNISYPNKSAFSK